MRSSSMTVLVLLGVTGCEPEHGPGELPFGDGGGGDGGDTGASDAAGDPTSGPCGMPAFDWLPDGSTGGVLEDQLIHEWSQVQILAVQVYVEDESGVSFSRLPAHGVEVHRVRYQTQDRGAPIDATTMVVFPDEDGPDSFPVLLFLHGTCGFNDQCAPSRGIEDSESDTYFNAVLMAFFSSWGYVVVAPDYIGLKSLGVPSPELHPYLVAEPTAIASWDAVRAASPVVFASTGQEAASQPVVVWGASQGGHAAAFAVRYAPRYAPELVVAGAVWAIPPTDLLAHTTAALTTLRNASANTVAFLAAAEQWYGPLPNGLSPVILPPYDSELQPALMASCSPDTLDGVTALDQVFTPALLDAVAAGNFASMTPWHCMAEENSLPRSPLRRLDDVPVLMVLGESDTLVDPALERASFAQLCSQGERIALLQCAGAGHTEAFFWSVDDALDFLEARLRNEVLVEFCVETTPVTCSNTP
jgi:dienelactone hydrolase